VTPAHSQQVQLIFGIRPPASLSQGVNIHEIVHSISKPEDKLYILYCYKQLKKGLSSFGLCITFGTTEKLVFVASFIVPRNGKYLPVVVIAPKVVADCRTSMI
jgi:hypothetical protein